MSADLAIRPSVLSEDMMPRGKQARHTSVKDIRSILRLTFEQELPIRAVSDRLKMSKTSVSTYLLGHVKRVLQQSGRFHQVWTMTRFWSNGCSAGWDDLRVILMSRIGRRLPVS